MDLSADHVRLRAVPTSSVSIPTIANRLKKQKSMFEVLTPRIKPAFNSYGLMEDDDGICHLWLVKC